MSHAPLFPQIYRQGSIIAVTGLLATGVYYDLAWRSLKQRLLIPHPANLEPRPWNAFQYFYWGLGASVLCFLLAGAADTQPNFLDHLVGLLMGLCGVIFAGMFGIGFIALWNLWAEAIRQVIETWRFRRYFRHGHARNQSLLLALPLAILRLVVALAVLALLGMVLEKIPKYVAPFLPHLMWLMIAAAFYALWKSRSHAALLLRLMLLVLFTLISLSFVVWLLAWVSSETAPVLVTMLAAITIFNAAFYARWIRRATLANDFTAPSSREATRGTPSRRAVHFEE